MRIRTAGATNNNNSVNSLDKKDFNIANIKNSKRYNLKLIGTATLLGFAVLVWLLLQRQSSSDPNQSQTLNFDTIQISKPSKLDSESAALASTETETNHQQASNKKMTLFWKTVTTTLSPKVVQYYFEKSDSNPAASEDDGYLTWERAITFLRTSCLENDAVAADVSGIEANDSDPNGLAEEAKEFKSTLTRILQESEFSSYFFECHPVTTENQSVQRFEFVLVDAPALSRLRPDPKAFSEHFIPSSEKAKGTAENNYIIPAVAFKNLGKDALLVVPQPQSEQYTDYTHVAVFFRNAPRAQVFGLLKLLGDSIAQEINKKPMWVSTSGLGVYWLHVRLDLSWPKYYQYRPYRNYSL